MDEQFHQRHPAPSSSCGFEFFGRNFADDFIERGFGNALQFAAKKNLAGANGFRSGAFAVNQSRSRLSPAPCAPRARRDFPVLLFQGRRFLPAIRNVKYFR